MTTLRIEDLIEFEDEPERPPRRFARPQDVPSQLETVQRPRRGRGRPERSPVELRGRLRRLALESGGKLLSVGLTDCSGIATFSTVESAIAFKESAKQSFRRSGDELTAHRAGAEVRLNWRKMK